MNETTLASELIKLYKTSSEAGRLVIRESIRGQWLDQLAEIQDEANPVAEAFVTGRQLNDVNR